MKLMLAALALLLAACTPTQIGVAHTHHGTPNVTHWPDVPIHVVHIMGWGTDNPQPSPGVYRWDTLDARITAVVHAGAEPVIALCCAPDWMKGGTPGVTDWTRLGVAPHPSRYRDFAALAATVAARYPEVRRFLVWNELKGYWDPLRNRWGIESYTALYNEVHRAIKAVRPDAQIGGPYVPIVTWQSPPYPSALSGPWGTVDQRSLDAVTYWLDHNIGADFVAVDGHTATRDAGWITDPADATAMFAEVTDWLTARTDLPVWWAEVHAVDPSWPLWAQAHVTVTALDSIRAAGADVAILWAPQAEPTGCTGCLWWADGTLTPLGNEIIKGD